MLDIEAELRARQQIFDALAEAVAEKGTMSRTELSAFAVAGETQRLLDTGRGIRNPRSMVATLSVLSSPTGPYSDREIEGGLFRYDYRSGSTGGDNTKLRRALELELPIVLLRKIEPNEYVPVFPVYVIADDDVAQQFVLAVDERLRFLRAPEDQSILERRYAERIARYRLHQAEFRGRVLRAYRVQCSVCSLQHGRLLDAAHIVGDAESEGEPLVSNGLSLCKIHHAAFDSNLLGISPEYVVAIDRGLLEESDGPMLRWGLQEMHGRHLQLPARKRDRPDRDRLATRWSRFGGSA